MKQRIIRVRVEGMHSDVRKASSFQTRAPADEPRFPQDKIATSRRGSRLSACR